MDVGEEFVQTELTRLAQKSKGGKVVYSCERICFKCKKPCSDAHKFCLAKGFENYVCNSCEPHGLQ